MGSLNDTDWKEAMVSLPAEDEHRSGVLTRSNSQSIDMLMDMIGKQGEIGQSMIDHIALKERRGQIRPRLIGRFCREQRNKSKVT